MADRVKSASQKQSLSLTSLLAVVAIGLAAAVYAAYSNVLQKGTSTPEPAPSVTIKQGTIIGKFVDDGTYPEPLEGFMGIPYAIPPVGEKRFRQADSVPTSDETLEAYYLGPR